MLFIYPFKADKKTFDDNKDELGFASKPREVKKRKTTKEIEIDRLQKLRKEELYYKNMVGLVEDTAPVDIDKVYS